MELKRDPDYMKMLVGRKNSKTNPKPLAKITARRLAALVDVSPSFIDRLVSGQVNSCSPRLARAIARELEIDVRDLFVPSASRSVGQIAAQRKAVATRIERVKASRQMEKLAA
ncbi:hypothetical protein [Arthrobacter pityocampae]|uniref:hypothetical protein n=1 Tax=Arthrobacter pityocampae TaxID=547334 RepID=UPI003736E43C